MSNPHQINPHQTSPYIAGHIPGAGRPRMFDTTSAKVIWTLVPLVSFGLASPIPFVVAASKGVIKAWLAAAYVVTTIALYGLGTVLVPADSKSHVMGFLIVLLAATAATHTSLLDNNRMQVGK
ncbi:hypothetical protein ACFQ61_10125 [Streptomyces sp. NPDC056500]|uniref:hypothetical protein n=1 Tax=Streptomyces sp. NPDC056500 TaxID=3345840 RepID=UPI0036888558